jgi:DNA-directed RNA polymerase specialized sigma24 family protein
MTIELIAKLPQCDDPLAFFKRLVQSDETAWGYAKDHHRSLLEEDVAQSVKKVIRVADIDTELLDIKPDDIYRMIYEIIEEAWKRFRAIVTAPDSKFQFVSHEQAYKYFRVITWNITREKFKSIQKEEAQRKNTVSIEGIEESEDISLDNFLYRQGGYSENDIDQEIILSLKIDALIEILEELNTQNPLHVNILMYKVVDGKSSKDIARIVGMTSASVDSTISRLKKHIRAYMVLKVKEDK